MRSEDLSTASFIISSLSLIVSSIVLIITILNHRRQRRLDNENHIFKIKIEDYKLILKEITEVFKLFPSESELHELIKYPERASAIADKIDDAVTKLSMFIVPYSIVLHPAVLKAIEELVIYFIDGDIEKHTEVEIKQELDRAHAKTNEIITMIRKDLYSDALNSRLVKRLK